MGLLDFTINICVQWFDSERIICSKVEQTGKQHKFSVVDQSVDSMA